MEAVGYIQNVQQGVVTVVVPNIDKDYLIEHREITEVGVKFPDGRTITADQRKKIYATLRDISENSGYSPDETKAIMKYEYIAKTGNPYFSLSNTDVTTANMFLDFLVEWFVEHGYHSDDDKFYRRAPNIGKYIYACLVYKKCCICGIHEVDLHHVDVIGSASRKTTEHIGRRAMALCRIHHDECRDIGQDSFDKRYSVFGIKIDKSIARIYNL